MVQSYNFIRNKCVFLQKIFTKMTKRYYNLIIYLLVCACAWANQPFKAVLTSRGSETLILSLKGEVEEGWHVNADLEIEESNGIVSRGELQKIREGHYIQMLRITGENYGVKGYFRYVMCDDEKCMAPEYVEFEYEGKGVKKDEKKEKELEKEKKAAEETAAVQPVKDDTIAMQPAIAQQSDSVLIFSPLWKPVISELKAFEKENNQESNNGLLGIIFIGFIGGLLALFTPCVWPIIPLTVSFFLKRQGGLRSSLLFGGSIVVMFVILGLLVTFIFGANAMNAVSTSAVFNISCFILLVIFGLSLLGLFELKLPMKWGNSLDEMAEKTSGLISISLMALTLVVVSFSCTAPVIGLLLVEVATHGSLLAPIVGMTSFAMALALPFTIFAFFPQLLSRMPRSGSWMTDIKVVLGVLELAFSLKFLSVADQSYGWNILSSDAMLTIWLLLAIGTAGYFAFQMRQKSSLRAMIPHLPLSVCTLVLAALLGNSLATDNKTLFSAFLPVDSESKYTADGVARHFRDYDEGMEYARQHNMPVFLDFTGFGCVNCRKMEGAVFSDERVKQVLEHNFVIIELYVDDRTALPQRLHAKINGKERTLRTVGDKWSLLESYKFGMQSQPFYVILNPNTGKPLTYSYAYDEDIDRFLEFLSVNKK